MIGFISFFLSFGSPTLAEPLLARAVPRVRGNITIDFAAIKLQNSPNLFSLPSLKNTFSLNLRNVMAFRSLSHFVSSQSSNLNGKLQISRAVFKDFQLSPICIASANSYKNSHKQYNAHQGSARNYDASLEDLEIEISYCSFLQCYQRTNFNWENYGTEGYASNVCGGAIFASKAASVSINLTVFEDCQATCQGGSIYLGETENQILISECDFVESGSFFGSAISFYTISSAVVKYCRFAGCYSTGGKSEYNTGCIVVKDAKKELIVDQCSFNNSAIKLEYKNYAEVYGEKSNIVANNLCILAKLSNIKIDSHIGVYVYPPAKPNPIPTNIRSDTKIYLYYFDADNQLKNDNLENLCANPVSTLNPTPLPTPEITLAPTLDPTLDPTHHQSPIETLNPSISATFIPTHEPTNNPTLKESTPPQTLLNTIEPTLNPSPLPATMKATLEPTNNNIVNDAKEGLTSQQKVTIGWAVPVAIVAVVLISLVAYCVVKDRRKAFPADDNEGNDEEFAFPNV